VDDALSRRVHKMHAIVVNMYMIYLKDRILEVVTTYQHYLKVRENLQHNDIQHKYKNYNLEEDVILLF
jgi:hypothetical protein